MKIIGTGSALPRKTVTNEDFTSFLDTNDEWIVSHTGISARQVITDETLLSLASEAGRRALLDAGVEAKDIDFLICSTVQGDTLTPSLGCLLCGELGIPTTAVDINAACAGFVYALDMADAYLTSKKAKTILIVSAEASTRLPDYNDRATCILFGDGAAAIVVTEGGDQLVSLLHTQSNLNVLNAWPDPGNSPFANEHPRQPLFMAGQDVYKFAVNAIVRDFTALTKKTEVLFDDIDLFLLHQANLRIIEAARHRLKLPEEKFPHNIEVRGNTSSASIPILLDELCKAGKIRPGMTLAMSAFGAGLITGACILKWTKA